MGETGKIRSKRRASCVREDETMIRLGIIGVGGIASAVVKGLKAKLGDELEVFLSPRNARRAEALRDAFTNVFIMDSNQEVLDRADRVIVAVLPDIAEEVVSSLRFRPDHQVISLVSKPKMADLKRWTGECRTLCRVIPLPFIEFRTGPVLIHPRVPEVMDMFDGLGDVVATDSEEEFILAQVLSCAMGPFYFLLDRLVAWMRELGLPPERSAPYLESMFAAMMRHASLTDPRELAELWKEMTPGGLNEEAIARIRADGAFESWVRALEEVRKRII